MAGFNEWEIENFSCWNEDFHSQCIVASSYFSLDIPPELYPRGFGRSRQHVRVNIPERLLPSDRELSFIGSDGSAICTRRFDGTYLDGPKLEDVASLIRENEPRHRDRLILRWNTPKGQQSVRLYSVINASSTFFQIKSEMFDSNYEKEISHIRYVSKDETELSIWVNALKINDTEVQFSLKSSHDERVIVRTTIWFFKGDKIIRKYENDRDIFQSFHYYRLPYEVTLKELQGTQAVMRCKIITGQLSSTSANRADFPLSPNIRITDFSNVCEKKSMEDPSFHGSIVSDVTGESNSSLISIKLQPENAVSVLTKDLVCLFQDHDFADFELRCGTVSFSTHRGILSARSPVFKAMLSGDMKEAGCGHVEVEDLDPHILGRFLSFLYSGATGEEALQWEEASKLYYAADKYQVPSLKEECAAVLRDSVALENVCEILSRADKHQDEELRSVAHDFISKNYHRVLESQNWEKLMITDPLLVAKTLTSLAKKIKHVKMSDSNQCAL